jgi:hypothetical protein
VTLQIVKGGARRPQMSCILFGPPGTWKTSTLACAQRALWLDFHGSTKTMGERPDCAWDPETGEGRPGNYVDLVDMVRDLAANKKLRAEHDWLILDGLDDVEQEFLLPEALRRADAKSLGENFFKPCDFLLAVHLEFRRELELLVRQGWNVGMTCHAQNIERVNADGVNCLVCDLKVMYVSGKLGKWDAAPIWRDWVDHCVYLDMEGGKYAKLDAKDKIAHATGTYGSGRVAYLRGEPWLEAKVRRLESVPSPMKCSSPDELWAVLWSKWSESFDSGALERKRAEVLALAQAYFAAGGKGSQEKLVAAVGAAKSTGALDKIAATLR